MARTKNNQRSASRVAVDVGATGTNPVSKLTVAILAVSVVAAVWAAAMMTPPGRVAYVYFYMYAEYYMGVLTLVSLSITIMVGLLSTDRLVLSIRQRVMLQSVHRTTGVMAVSSLVVHLWTKTVESHIRVIDIFIPFLRPYDTFYVGLGTISGYTLAFVTWTGIARARFIGRGKPWMWRSIHSVSYLLWPIALLHGLSAGRPAKSWVIVSYVVCVLLVLIGLAVRISVSLNRRKDFASNMGTAGVVGAQTVGGMVPTSQGAKRSGRRGAAAPPEPQTLGPVAVLDTWQPAATPAAPVTAPPAMEEPAPSRGRRFADDETLPAPRQRLARDEEVYDERPRGGRRRYADDDFEYDDQAAPVRGRRYADDDLEDTSTRMRPVDMGDTSTRMRPVDMGDTSTRMRRVDMGDTSTRMRRVEMGDTSTRMRRVEMDDTSTRMRRVEMDDSRYDEEPRGRRYADDDEPAPRSRWQAEDTYEPAGYDQPRGRRRAEEEYDEIPRQRGARYAADGRYGRDEVDAPRTRRDRGADDYDSADSGRHSRSQFAGLDEEDSDYLEPDETPTLIDMASRRARRAAQQETVRGQAGRGARRGGRGRSGDEAADDAYWSQLRGEAN